MKITVQTTIQAPIHEVWHRYTTPSDIVHWNTASPDWHTPTASVDLREGGMFSSRMEAKDGSMGFDFAGTYTKIETHKKISYEFGGRIADIDFTPTENGIHVSICFDAETVYPVEQQQQGWQAILDHFKQYVESIKAS